MAASTLSPVPWCLPYCLAQGGPALVCCGVQKTIRAPWRGLLGFEVKSQGFSVPQDSPRAGSHLLEKRTPRGEAVFWGWISQLSLNQPCSEHSGRNGAGGRDRGSPSWWGTSLLDRTVCNCGGPVKRTGSLLQHKSHRFPIKGSHSEAQCSVQSLI